ncbi:MAG: WbuC family cupin fold metalloprotein, partial [Prevotella sp.]|nr:WbuC family cupin fold metalloprotein [Prevotella sp.]
LRGKMFVVFYDDLGAQVERYLLDPTTGNYGVHIPAGQWHGIEVLEPSAILEVKDGPYTPLQPEDMLD